MASFNLDDWHIQYHEKDNQETARTIGIEFEAKIKDNACDLGASFLDEDYLNAENIGQIDDEYDTYVEYSDRAEYIKNTMHEMGIEVAGVGYDGGGKEFVTYPESISFFKEGGSENLKKLVGLLNKATIADVKSGTHIHVGALSSDTNTTWDNLYWFCMCFGDELQKIFGRRSSWAYTPLPKETFGSNSGDKVLFEAPQKRPAAPDRKNMYSKGSIIVNRGNRYEFRGPKASNNLEEILAWVELCNNIVNLCGSGYIRFMPFAEVLKGKYIRKYVRDISSNPKRVITAEDRAKTIARTKYVLIKRDAREIL